MSKPTFRIYVKSGPCFALTIKDEKLVLAPFNPKNEEQFWMKESSNTKVVDVDGGTSFALVNKATGQAIKRTVQNQLQLVPYKSNIVDVSLFWSESFDSNDGYKAIRTVITSDICLDAEGAETNVDDGTNVVLWARNNQNNQWWKIEEYTFVPPRPSYKITNMVNPRFVVTIRNGEVVMANPDAYDKNQHWYKYDGPAFSSALPRFCLVNKATEQAIQRATQQGEPVRLVQFSTNLITDATLLWNHDTKDARGWGVIRVHDYSHQHWHPQGGQVKDGQQIRAKASDTADNSMCWRITPY